MMIVMILLMIIMMIFFPFFSDERNYGLFRLTSVFEVLPPFIDKLYDGESHSEKRRSVGFVYSKTYLLGPLGS